MKREKASLTLKWGTVKAWSIPESRKDALEALQKWADYGYTLSVAAQKDTPEQKQALVDALEFFDEFWLDWEGKKISRKKAKEYILEYDKD